MKRLRRFFASRRRRAMAAAAVAVTAVVLALPRLLPSPLVRARRAEPGPSLRIVDREGRELREVLAADGTRSRPVTLAEVSPHLVAAVELAEDRRFRSHPGVDPIAFGRALLADLRARRLVQGGSTLTMQVARLVRGRGPKGLIEKARQAVDAIRIEAHHGKDEILLAWLNRAPFGNGLVGVEAASWAYFGAPARALTPAQAAALAVIPRAPSLYNPWADRDAVVARRDGVLRAMAARGDLDPEALERALAEPLLGRPRRGAFEAPHFVEALRASGLLEGRSGVVRASLDLDLQSAAERTLAEAIDRLADRGVGNGAVVVLDTRTREVLAWVGSADFFARRAGQVDGVLARRQPGSTLKPFVYAAGLEASVITTATVLADLPAAFATGRGTYAPDNYDSSYRGPVRARVALAGSLNVPAVKVLERAGVGRALALLRRAGFDSLAGSAEQYGLGLALGDGEVRLLELASAYATLAEGGVYRPVALEAGRGEGVGGERILDERVAWLIADVLSDDEARSATFGRDSVLATPFPTLVKTGTTKNFRDNWCVGATPEVTVGVWVGNFDGAPMRKVSGVTGAGPVWRAVMLAAMSRRPAREFVRPDGVVERRVCPLSGMLPGPSCLTTVVERFVAGNEPVEACTWHVTARVDPATGAAIHPGCPGGESRVFERYPQELARWAKGAGRPLVPETGEVCPEIAAMIGGGAGREQPVERARTAVAPHPLRDVLRIVSPEPSGFYAFDPGIPESLQRLPLEARLPEGADVVAWWVDGERQDRPQWRVRRGEHRFRAVAVVAGRELSDEVTLRVR